MSEFPNKKTRRQSKHPTKLNNATNVPDRHRRRKSKRQNCKDPTKVNFIPSLPRPEGPSFPRESELERPSNTPSTILKDFCSRAATTKSACVLSNSNSESNFLCRLKIKFYAALRLNKYLQLILNQQSAPPQRRRHKSIIDSTDDDEPPKIICAEEARNIGATGNLIPELNAPFSTAENLPDSADQNAENLSSKHKAELDQLPSPPQRRRHKSIIYSTDDDEPPEITCVEEARNIGATGTLIPELNSPFSTAENLPDSADQNAENLSSKRKAELDRPPSPPQRRRHKSIIDSTDDDEPPEITCVEEARTIGATGTLIPKLNSPFSTAENLPDSADQNAENLSVSKRKAELDRLPSSNYLTIGGIKSYLDKFNVKHNPKASKGRLIKLYDAMKEKHDRHTSSKSRKRPRKGIQSRPSCVSSDSEDDRKSQPSITQRRQRQIRSRQKYASADGSYNFILQRSPSTLQLVEPTELPQNSLPNLDIASTQPPCSPVEMENRSASIAPDFRPSESQGINLFESHILPKTFIQLLEPPEPPVDLPPITSPRSICHNINSPPPNQLAIPQLPPQNLPEDLPPIASPRYLYRDVNYPPPIPQLPPPHHSSTTAAKNQSPTPAAETACRYETSSTRQDPEDVNNWRNQVLPDAPNNGEINLAHNKSSIQSQLLHAFKEFVSGYTDTNHQIVKKLDEIIVTLKDLNLQPSSPRSSSRHTPHPLTPASPIRNSSCTTTPRRGGTFLKLIWTHVSTLLGTRRSRLPHPSRPANEEDSRVEFSDEGVDSDPNYPYPGGPGHPSASKETLEIIWNMMQDKGIQSFRPNFSKPYDSHENKPLWDFAVESFVELVRCNEYNAMESKEQIEKAIYIHVNKRLRQRYSKENNWEEAQRDEAAKNLCRSSRLNNLRQKRLAFLDNLPGFRSLAPIVQACCSNDDTDEEASQPIQKSYRKKQPKLCVARPIPWRHSQISRLMITLDTLMARAAESTPKGPSGAAAQIRRRDTFLHHSKLKPPHQLAKGCFDHDWRASQPETVIQALQMHPNPVKPLIEKLQKLL
ncbi:hypothetical protein PtB15_13B302 [Puccinia triticina]|nr:hypothetical protein PtB15_13B302 [Puccinia triticina]